MPQAGWPAGFLFVGGAARTRHSSAGPTVNSATRTPSRAAVNAYRVPASAGPDRRPSPGTRVLFAGVPAVPEFCRRFQELRSRRAGSGASRQLPGDASTSSRPLQSRGPARVWQERRGGLASGPVPRRRGRQSANPPQPQARGRRPRQPKRTPYLTAHRSLPHAAGARSPFAWLTSKAWSFRVWSEPQRKQGLGSPLLALRARNQEQQLVRRQPLPFCSKSGVRSFSNPSARSMSRSISRRNGVVGHDAQPVAQAFPAAPRPG